MAQFTVFGKAIVKKLVDIERPQTWLIDQVKEKTGLYFDDSYLYKIRTGQLRTPKVVNAICEVLEIEYPTDKQDTDKNSA